MWRLLLLNPIILFVLLPSEPPHRDAPRALDSQLEVTLFAQEPQILHPVACTYDSKGRLLVVESHTHFRPANYQGPKADRIQMLEDTDGDGRADRITTFFEGTKATMDIALAPDGSIYVATRYEILRLRDTKGIGQADEHTRIVFLDTKGDYPHNGLSGLTFDASGNLLFGMGENLGVSYTLHGSDGTKFTGGGEGGNIFRCTADGAKLHRVATGFWNPFGVHVTKEGRMVAVDNDPDASPPCRLLHVVEGGDYGYQFRYGRSGRHPFQSWNGQLPGTIPMLAGTGESPCEVLRYEHHGLPAEYFGNYLVTSWADHRLEKYELVPKGLSYSARQNIVVQGGKDFRPTGLAIAPDGSLMICDWVLADYQLHGKGSVWQVKPKQPFTKPSTYDLRTAELENKKKTQQVLEALATSKEHLRKMLCDALPLEVQAESIPLLKDKEDVPTLLNFLTIDDPFLRHLVVRHLAQHPALLAEASKTFSTKSQDVQLQLLLAQREAGGDYLQSIPEKLRSPHEEVRFLTLKWIADLALKQFRGAVETGLADTTLSPRMTLAYATALARIDQHEVSETLLADRFVARLSDTKLTDAQRLQFLRLVPVSHDKLTLALLTTLLSGTSDKALQDEVALSLLLHPKAKVANWQSLSNDPKVLPSAKAILQLGLASPTEVKDFSAGRPGSLIRDLPDWVNAFGTGGSAEAGRQLFYAPRGPGCFRCHAVLGRGNDIGPDLTTIGRSEPVRLIEALVHPSATVAPRYIPHSMVMHDGRILTGLLVRTYYDVCTYLSPEGKLFEVKSGDVAESSTTSRSLMPENLLNPLTDTQVKDLLAYLRSCK
jgi:putative membrane-bound dehydrogenase-like protein